MSKEQYLKKLEKKEEKPKEIKLEWGKGLAQKREAEDRQQELELEKDKPFARTRDDPELDRLLKEKVRWCDPMAHLVKLYPILETVRGRKNQALSFLKKFLATVGWKEG